MCRLLEANANTNVGHPLQEAARTNQTAIFKLLLFQNADVNAVCDLDPFSDYLSSPMMAAVLHECLDMIQLFLDAGVDPQVIKYSLPIATRKGEL